MTHFSSLGLSTQFLDTLKSQGYDTPTPIQALAIPPVLEGRDILGCAQTGTGKTAAFALPLLDLLQSRSNGARRGRKIRPRALILSPTRELAGQIDDSLRVYGQSTSLRGTVIFGGVNQNRQVRQLQAGVDVIVATPGRLLDLIQQGFVDLGAIEVFVLDEADRMLDMGFIKPIRTVAGMLPEKRQTLLFSATMPANIRSLADSLLSDPVRVAVEPDESKKPLIDQSVYFVQADEKPALLRHLLNDEAVERAVVFSRTKHGANKLAEKLVKEGVKADAIHGNKSQNQRQRALDAFRSGRCRVLIATDVAARGLDIDGVTHVINFHLPDEPESYVHRIGRTGRAGATGLAIAMCSPEEFGLLRTIERIIGEEIPVTEVPESLGLKAVRPPAPGMAGSFGKKPGKRGTGHKRRSNGSGSKRYGGPKSADSRRPKKQSNRKRTGGRSASTNA